MITLSKLPKKTLNNLSERVKNEYEAHRFYRYVANCLGNKGFKLAASYYAKEAADEITHSEMVQNYATDWNVEVDLLPLPKVDLPEDEENLVGIICADYKMELDLLNAYQKDYIEAFENGELHTAFFLKQMVDIQSKSVVEISEQINAMELFDQTDKNWLYNFEKKLFGN